MTRARPNAQLVGAALSDNEARVLRCLLTGATSKEIAAHLGKHYRTVEAQRSSLLSKTGALSLAQLGYFAAKQGYEPDHTLTPAREPAKVQSNIGTTTAQSFRGAQGERSAETCSSRPQSSSAARRGLHDHPFVDAGRGWALSRTLRTFRARSFNE